MSRPEKYKINHLAPGEAVVYAFDVASPEQLLEAMRQAKLIDEAARRRRRSGQWFKTTVQHAHARTIVRVTRLAVAESAPDGMMPAE